MNIRKCRQCGKMVDFDEPWCDHETMEESAWIDIISRQKEAALAQTIDEVVEKIAQELLFCLPPDRAHSQ